MSGITGLCETKPWVRNVVRGLAMVGLTLVLVVCLGACTGAQQSRSNLMELFSPDFMTAGVSFNNAEYRFTTQLEGNRFSAATFQIYEAAENTFIENIGLGHVQGVYSGAFKCELPDGDYKLVFKINSNLADEFMSCTVRLEEGKEYRYSYELISLAETEAVVSNVSFSVVIEE